MDVTNPGESLVRSRVIAGQMSEMLTRLQGIKVIYTDLDNTLLGPKSSIFIAPDKTYTLEPARALLAVVEAGIDVVVISGRNDYQLREICRVLGLENYIAELGCMLFYDQGREAVKNYHYPVPAGKTLHRAIADSGAPAFLLEHFKGRLEYHTPWSKNQKCTHLFRGFIDVHLANGLLAIEGFNNLRVVDNGGSRSQGDLEPLPEIRVYHLLPKDTNKASAIIADQERRGLSFEETIALGDSLADLEMAGAVGAFFLVADGIGDDSRLSAEFMTYRNTYLTTQKMGLGWAEVARLVLKSRPGI